MNRKEDEKYIKACITGIVIVCVGILFFFFVYRARDFSGALQMILTILRPFVYGAAIAYLVTPLSRQVEKAIRKIIGEKRAKLAFSLANFFSLILALLIISGILLLIIPRLVDSISQIIQMAPTQFEALQQQFEEYVKDDPELEAQARKFIQEVSTTVETFVSDLLGGGEGGSGQTMVIVSGVAAQASIIFGVFKDMLLGLIVSLYLLFRRERLADQAELLVHGAFKPEQAEWIKTEVRFANHLFNSFFMGKLIDSLIVGVICFVGCLLMGFGNPLLIAVIVGVTNIIPFFGPYIGAIPSALLLLLESPMHCLMFLVFIIVLQQVDGNLIGPRILGNSTGLSGLSVLLAILLFGGLWGIVGMLIGVPLMAVIYDVVRQIIYKGIRRNGMNEVIEEYNAKYH